MTTTPTRDQGPAPLDPDGAPGPAGPDPAELASASRVGPVGRLGAWSVDHRRIVFVAWALVAVAFGMLAPQVEHALSGAGWEATGSESVAARDVIEEEFGGLGGSALQAVIVGDGVAMGDPAFNAAVDETVALLQDEPDIGQVVPPQPGMTISEDGTTAVVQAGAGVAPDDMVRLAEDLHGELDGVGGDGVEVLLTGSSAMWADFNAANRDAMMKSELISWPVTMAIMVVAFGSLVAAGLPLALTIVGLVAAAGSLVVVGSVWDISIWAMNFAMMFALALGIDYALFIVHRFRGALLGSKLPPREAVAVTMDTAGKAVLFSGITVFISLSAVLLVPSPAFRSMSLGIMIAVAFVLAAALTLLPALLGWLGPRVDKGALPWHDAGTHRSARFERWAGHLWARPVRYVVVPALVLAVLALPLLGLRTGMPSIAVVPEDDSSRRGYDAVQEAFGEGAPGALQVVAPAGLGDEVMRAASGVEGVAAALPPMPGEGDRELVQVVPVDDPSSEEMKATIERLRAELPGSGDEVLVGGAAAENHDLEEALADRTLPVLGVVLALGFLLLLVALQAPVLAAVGVVVSLLATGAAFGIARWLFQDGYLVEAIGIEPQGFLDAWAPVFFFAMVFAISMDYTVFLLSSAKEHHDRGEDARASMVGGLAHSGRVIVAAAVVMVAVFFTFALQGPLPPREMGIILGIAVLLDAFLVRLVLLPAAMGLLRGAAWWCPAWLRRVLPDVKFGH